MGPYVGLGPTSSIATRGSTTTWIFSETRKSITSTSCGMSSVPGRLIARTRRGLLFHRICL